MQETRAQSLVQEDPICHGAQGLEPQVTTVEAHVLQLKNPACRRLRIETKTQRSQTNKLITKRLFESQWSF